MVGVLQVSDGADYSPLLEQNIKSNIRAEIEELSCSASLGQHFEDNLLVHHRLGEALK